MSRKEKIKAILVAKSIENPDSLVDELDKMFGEELNGNFIPKSKFDEVNEQLKTEKATSKTLQDQITTLKTFEGTNEELKTKIATMEAEAKTAKADGEKKLLEFRKKAAIKLALSKDKAQDPDLVLSLLKLDDIEIDDNDKITSGYKEQVAAVKKERAFLFKSDNNPGPGTGKYAFLKGNKPGAGDASDNEDHQATETETIIKGVIAKGKKDGQSQKVNPDYFFGGNNSGSGESK